MSTPVKDFFERLKVAVDYTFNPEEHERAEHGEFGFEGGPKPYIKKSGEESQTEGGSEGAPGLGEGSGGLIGVKVPTPGDAPLHVDEEGAEPHSLNPELSTEEHDALREAFPEVAKAMDGYNALVAEQLKVIDDPVAYKKATKDLHDYYTKTLKPSLEENAADVIATRKGWEGEQQERVQEAAEEAAEEEFKEDLESQNNSLKKEIEEEFPEGVKPEAKKFFKAFKVVEPLTEDESTASNAYHAFSEEFTKTALYEEKYEEDENGDQIEDPDAPGYYEMELVDRLSASIQKHQITSDQTVYRGLHNDNFKGEDYTSEENKAFVNSFLNASPGDIIHNRAFSSVSPDLETADIYGKEKNGVTLEIKMKKGSHAYPIVYGIQPEAIIDKDSKFRIDSVDKENRHVKITLMSDEKAAEVPQTVEDEAEQVQQIGHPYIKNADMDDDTQEALYYYHHGESGNLSESLHSPSEKNKDYRASAERVDKAIQNSEFTEDAKLYRGISHYAGYNQQVEDSLNQKEGDEVTWQGLSSTSSDPDAAAVFHEDNEHGRGVAFEIDAPKGTKGLSMNNMFIKNNEHDSFQHEEQEVLLGHNSRLKVTGVDRENRKINYRLLPPETKQEIAQQEVPKYKPLEESREFSYQGYRDYNEPNESWLKERGFDDASDSEKLELQKKLSEWNRMDPENKTSMDPVFSEDASNFEQTKHFDISHHDAILEYQEGTGGSQKLNLRAAKQQLPEGFEHDNPEFVDEQVKALQEAINSFTLKKDLTVYRGLRESSNPKKKEESKKRLEALLNAQPGAIIDNPQFSSTSMSRDIAEEFMRRNEQPAKEFFDDLSVDKNIPTTGVMLSIDLKKGHKALPLNETNSAGGWFAQREVLLNSGSKFKVESVDKENRHVKISLMDGS